MIRLKIVEGDLADAVRAAASSAFVHALGLCDALGIESVAAPLLKGGWRMTAAQAMTMMLGAIANTPLRHPLALEIRILDEAGAVTQMRELARSLGLVD